jgi:hypothetical protein
LWPEQFEPADLAAESAQTQQVLEDDGEDSTALRVLGHKTTANHHLVHDLTLIPLSRSPPTDAGNGEDIRNAAAQDNAAMPRHGGKIG